MIYIFSANMQMRGRDGENCLNSLFRDWYLGQDGNCLMRIVKPVKQFPFNCYGASLAGSSRFLLIYSQQGVDIYF
jgi:hypothetical protein